MNIKINVSIKDIERKDVVDLVKIYFPYLNEKDINSIKNEFLKTNKDFLKGVYGDENGNINVLAGTLDINNDDASIVITDYMADALIYFNPTKYVSDECSRYEYIVNMGKINNRYDVAAIIDTGYMSRYKELIDTYNKIINNQFIEEVYKKY